MKKKSKKESSLKLTKESKASVLISISSEIEELEEKLEVLKAQETALKEGILDDLNKEQIRAFSADGYDFSISRSYVFVVKNAITAKTSFLPLSERHLSKH